MREEGFALSKEQGKEDLLDAMIQLNEILMNTDRMDDLKKAMSDKLYMKALLQEFKLL